MYNAINSRYTYSGTDILKNKLNIKDKEELDKYQIDHVKEKLIEIKNKDMGDKFDSKRLKNIHEFLFNDIFDFAGKYRFENITKDNFKFAEYEYIEENLENILNNIDINKLKKLSLDEVTQKISYILTELNVLHPFREGNGRAIREFVRQILEKLGYVIDFQDIDYEKIIKASKLAIVDDSYQQELLKENISKK